MPNLNTDLTYINFEILPKEILDEIPYSIRAVKSHWKKNELPYDILHLVESFFKQNPTINYSNIVYDIKPAISKYSDFVTVESKKNLVLEYIKNYFKIGINAYPFDPTFYSPLKTYLQNKNTDTVNSLIQNEIVSICNILSNDLSMPIDVPSVNVEKVASSDGSILFNIVILMSINGEEQTMTLIG
jgi:hypothetical protein